MHKLNRQVRFSINPFLSEQVAGYNSFASKPTGQGLSIFLELNVELLSDIDRATGFVVNVSDVDKAVRQCAVPVFTDWITRREYIGFFDISSILAELWNPLAEQFKTARLGQLTLKLNPFRKITIYSEVPDMIYFSEKFEFAATHKLWNQNFSQQKNLEIFGKCANPQGHGHNYIVEVTTKMPRQREDFNICNFERVIDCELVSILDHKNLNLDIEYFSENIPTMENIVTFAWERLSGKLAPALLHCITIWETDKASCSYYG